MKKDTELKYRYLHLFVHICIVIVTLFSFSQVRIRDLVQVSAGGIEGKYTDILNLEIYKNTDLVFEKNKIQQSENTEELAVLIDEYANYKPDSFRNHTLIVNESSYPILAHSESAILVKAKPSELIKAVGDSTRYKIQNNKTLGVLKKLYSKMPKVPITPVEPFLALACIILAYINRHFLGQHFKQYKLLYALILLIPATLAFSLLISSGQGGLKSGIKEVMQSFAWLGLGFFFAYFVIRKKTYRTTFLVCLGLGASAMIIFALIEFFQLNYEYQNNPFVNFASWDSVIGFEYQAERSGITGTNASIHMLTSYLAVCSILLWGLAGLTKIRAWIKCSLYTLSLISLCLISSYSFLFISIVSIIVLESLKMQKQRVLLFKITLLSSIPLYISQVNPALKELHVVYDSPYRYSDPMGLLPMPAKGKSKNTFAAWDETPQYLMEKQAALHAFSQQPIYGIGTGNYATSINQYFAKTPKAMSSTRMQKTPANLMEKDRHAMWYIVLAENGLIGITAWGALLVFLITKIKYVGRMRLKKDQVILLGISNAMVVLFVLGNFYSNYSVRGVQWLFIFAFAIPFTIQHRKSRSRNLNRKNKA